MRDFVKNLVESVFLVLSLPFFIVFKILTLLCDKDKTFSTFSQLLSLFPGYLGCQLRLAFFRLTMTDCQKSVVISFSTLFSQLDTELQQGVYIGPQCNIGKCKIEANCLLGSGVHVMSGKGQHNFSDLNTPLKDQGGVFNKVTIGEDSWIGNGALILANIGKKCVVAAGSVVINDVPDFAIVAGNPAKIIKMRNE